MRFNPRLVSSAAALAFTCAVTAAAYFYKNRSQINEVMVFCKLQYNAYNCFDKLMSYIDAAKKNINICMPGIQNPAIQGRLVKLIRDKNIKVQIIIDRSGYKSSDFFLLKELIEVGAELKCHDVSGYKMQHKFCLIDDKVLMTGTLNWGKDRSLDHWNYVYITNKSQLVEPVKREFYQMWDEFTTITGQRSPSDDHDTDSDQEDCEEAASEREEPPFRALVTTPELLIT